jgi:hypothetical protein
MSEAPERIMAYGEINTKWGVRSFQFCEFKCQPMPMQGKPSFPLTEYVRADRIEELEAKLAAERERIADLERRLKLWEPQNTWSLDGGRWPIRKGDTP